MFFLYLIFKKVRSLQQTTNYITTTKTLTVRWGNVRKDITSKNKKSKTLQRNIGVLNSEFGFL